MAVDPKHMYLNEAERANQDICDVFNLKTFWFPLFKQKSFSVVAVNNNAIIFHLPHTSNHLHSLQVKNCDSNYRLVLNEDDNGKFRLERVEDNRFWLYG